MMDWCCCQTLVRVSLAGLETVPMDTIYLQCIHGGACPYLAKKVLMMVQNDNEEICVEVAQNFIYSLIIRRDWRFLET